MGKKAPAAPPAPDPYVTAQAQTAANKETAIANAYLNRVDQNTPYGSLKYSVVGGNPDGTPKFQSDIRFTPLGQQMFDDQTKQDLAINNIAGGYLNRIQDTMGQAYDYGNLPPLPDADSLEAGRRRAEEALYSRLEPQMQRDENAIMARLANQGVAPGSEAYRNAMDEFNRMKTDARNQAIVQGGQEQSRLFGLGAARRQQAIQEYDAQRSRPLNEFNALRSAAQIQNPQFTGVPGTSVAGTDIGGYINNAYQGAMNSYNQQVASRNATTGALFGLGGSLGMAKILASDRRLKKDIERIATTPAGLGVYRYEYIDVPGYRYGVMADEVEKLMPDAVLRDSNGLKMVDYSRVR